MKYPNLEKLDPGDLWRWCNYRADTVVCSEQIEADQHGWRQAADLIYYRGVELAKAADTIERLQGLSTDLELLAKKRATLLENATQERDAARAEVERLKARTEKQADMIRTIDPLYR